jgi:hypothetical protein
VAECTYCYRPGARDAEAPFLSMIPAWPGHAKIDWHFHYEMEFIRHSSFVVELSLDPDPIYLSESLTSTTVEKLVGS